MGSSVSRDPQKMHVRRVKTTLVILSAASSPSSTSPLLTEL